MQLHHKLEDIDYTFLVNETLRLVDTQLIGLFYFPPFAGQSICEYCY